MSTPTGESFDVRLARIEEQLKSLRRLVWAYPPVAAAAASAAVEWSPTAAGAVATLGASLADLTLYLTP